MVVQNFVNAHPEFMPEELPPLDIPVLREGPGIMTVPLDGVDGFYIARLRRKS